MNNTREMIVEEMHKNGFDMQYTDVLDGFLKDPLLSQYVADNKNPEQEIWIHLNEYITTLMGVQSVDIGAEADPTVIQPVATVSAPTCSSQTQDAIAKYMVANQAKLDEISRKCHMVAVLADKEYPGNWLKDKNNAPITTLPVKGGKETMLEKMAAQYHPGSKVDELLAKEKSTFIPTNEQLQMMAAIDKAKPTASGKPKKDAFWYKFDNNAAFASVKEQLTNGDGQFKVLLAPKEDQTDGEGKVTTKGWKWNTKGYVVSVPSGEVGVGHNVDRCMSRKQLEAFLTTECAGYIPSTDESALSCTVYTAKHKKGKSDPTSAAASAEPLKVGVRIKGNNPGSHPDVRYINEIGVGNSVMSFRSDAYYLAVHVSSEGKWSVKKVRLPLTWEGAPSWERKEEYLATFPITPKNGGIGLPDESVLQQLTATRIQMVANVIGNPTEMAKKGLTGFCEQIHEQERLLAAQAEQSLRNVQ